MQESELLFLTGHRIAPVVTSETDKARWAPQGLKNALPTFSFTQNTIDTFQVPILRFSEPFWVGNEGIDAGIAEKTGANIFKKQVYVIGDRSEAFMIPPPLPKAVSAMTYSMTSNFFLMRKGTIKRHFETIYWQGGHDNLDITGESAAIMPSDYIKAYHTIVGIREGLRSYHVAMFKPMHCIVKSRHRCKMRQLTTVACRKPLAVACLLTPLSLLSKPQIGIVTTLFE